MNSPSIPGHGALEESEAGDNRDMELDQINTAGDGVKLPLHEDIMQLAMLGEVGPIQKLLDEGRYSIKRKDEEGITPLHVEQSALQKDAQRLTRLYISGPPSTITIRCVNI